MGRPFLAPRGVPADRVAGLRKAFMDTMQDQTFQAEAEKANLEITSLAGDAVQKIMANAANTPPAILKKTAAMLKVEPQDKKK